MTTEKQFTKNIRFSEDSISKECFVEDHITGESGTVYKVGGVVARGSSGYVFRCRTPSQTGFAVKFLRTFNQETLEQERFDFEVLVLRNLDHPNIMPFYDAGLAESSLGIQIPFYVTKCYATTLMMRVRQGPLLSYEEIKEYAKQICDAFDQVHSRGIVHRDIKSNNFLLARSQIILCDFGIAKAYTEEGAELLGDRDLLETVQGVGNPTWMSPELLQHTTDKTVKVDHRSDIFQIGKLFWYMHTGGEHTLPNEETSEGDRRLINIVIKATQTAPEERYQSAGEMKAAFL